MKKLFLLTLCLLGDGYMFAMDDVVPTIMDRRVKSIRRLETEKCVFYSVFLDGACVVATRLTNGKQQGATFVRRDGKLMRGPGIYGVIEEVYDAHFAPKEVGELEENA